MKFDCTYSILSYLLNSLGYQLLESDIMPFSIFHSGNVYFTLYKDKDYFNFEYNGKCYYHIDYDDCYIEDEILYFGDCEFIL